MNKNNVLEVEYKIYNQTSQSTLIIRESADGPGYTEIIQQDPGESITKAPRLLVEDIDIPLLIEALTRHVKNVKGVDDLSLRENPGSL